MPGAALFDLFEATLYTWIGATLGATLAFLLARLLGRDFFAQLLAGRLQALDERLSRNGFFNMLILRLVPLIPFNAINFGAGLTSIRLRDYVLATAIGILPGTFVYQYLFSRLGKRTYSTRNSSPPWVCSWSSRCWASGCPSSCGRSRPRRLHGSDRAIFFHRGLLSPA